jgi:solute carrier family 25 (mitochondrial aspartate/glutamate transporter), member 12/13
MKGLQGERLRQSFKYFDADQDGFIRPEQFKRIILVRLSRGTTHIAPY